MMCRGIFCRIYKAPSHRLTPTFGVINEITGKSITTLFNTISLLKLPPEIQAAIRAENLPVSQGYLFAANLDQTSTK